ncbi:MULTISPECIES: hypothetical protein [Romboutsia]|uniref:Mpv17/PMP22 n=1 Tax=Romboutsia hominis TaxID=1507512 RepID=A0A2P2BUN9_9FIRM|nr:MULTISPECIES: hypothetical protein [Romboutsia]MCH1959127.1 hypothetical protein [Romboutsia hominis]MCH1968247.1 hypothetical protein [Romboutsia hominis]MDB8789492.1 hypothetical protein [Romboutsia sp. 1001216sp1]MDB8793898.1 hypothetical protein [Romboutsia sp. 1001216sp1]MDB8796643.1 hypothetical protein [Romboutsia sp. 1001216sp1]
MKKGDFIWGGILLIWILILVIPVSRDLFITVTGEYPYVSGFIKFAVLATMGELLGMRISYGYWKQPNGVMFRAIIWGVIGIVITLGLPVFSKGVEAAQEMGKLPFKESIFAHAFLTSAIMNILQSPAVFLFHKCTDTYIDIRHYKNGGRVSLRDITNKIDWYTYIDFTVLKTIPFFWIPCHTIVFLFEPQYQVIVSAFASIALGLILAMANKSKLKSF